MLTRTLDDIMEFGHLIKVNEDGSIDDNVWYVHTPEVIYVDTDEDGSILDEHEKALIEEQEREGWRFYTTGYSGQYLYHGPIMHQSEFIGGRLERDIREEPGYYVAVVVDCLAENEYGETDSAGWAVLYREALPDKS